MKAAAFIALAMLAAPLQAQTMPQPGAENPRLQTVRWTHGSEYLLTALPMTGLTVLFEPGEQVQRVTLDATRAFQVQVSAERDGLLVVPQVQDAAGTMLVATDQRNYRMRLRTGTGLMAAYLVRFVYGYEQEPVFDPVPEPALAPVPAPTGETWTYRVEGDREVRPASISDDGVRTRIVFAPNQALPAVFAIGPSGEEQVVNGYMRGGVYVIDRVWQELVFRIDDEKAAAERASEPESRDG